MVAGAAAAIPRSPAAALSPPRRASSPNATASPAPHAAATRDGGDEGAALRCGAGDPKAQRQVSRRGRALSLLWFRSWKALRSRIGNRDQEFQN